MYVISGSVRWSRNIKGDVRCGGREGKNGAEWGRERRMYAAYKDIISVGDLVGEEEEEGE